MSTDDTSGRYDLSQTWTNADEVLYFLKQHPHGTRYAVGDLFTLPDIEQTYVVHAVRPFVSGKTSTLYLEFQATCAVEGCGKDFLTTKTITEIRKTPYLIRTCEDHRRRFKSPDPDAWKTSAELAVRAKEKAEARAKAEQKVREAVPRTGPNERAVLDAIEALSMVRDTAPVSLVVDTAVGLLERPQKGVRDTRRQRAVRALQSLRKDRRVAVARDDVVL